MATYVDSTATTDVGTAATGALTASPTVGNVLILVSISADAGAITPPAGYTSLYTSTADAPSIGVYYRVIAGGEDTTPNLTVPGYGHTTYVFEYSGLDSAALLADSGETRVYGTAADAVTVTPSAAGDIVLGIIAVPNGTTGSVTLTGVTEREDLAGYFITSGAGDTTAVSTSDVVIDGTTSDEQFLKLIGLVLKATAAAAEDAPAEWVDEPAPPPFLSWLYGFEAGPLAANVTPDAPLPSSVVSFVEPPPLPWQQDLYEWEWALAEEATSANLDRGLSSTVTHSAALTRAATTTQAVSATTAHTASLARATATTRAVTASAGHSATLARTSALPRGLSASASHAASLARALVAGRPVGATAAHTASLARSQALSRPLTATTAPTASLARAQALGRALSASQAHSATLAALAARARALASAISHTATLTRQQALTRSATTTTTHSAALGRVGAVGRALTATVGHAAALVRRQTLTRALSSSQTHSAAVGAGRLLLAALSSTISHAAALVRGVALVRASVADAIHDASIQRAVGLTREVEATAAHTADVTTTRGIVAQLASEIAHSAALGIQQAFTRALTWGQAFQAGLTRVVTQAFPIGIVGVTPSRLRVALVSRLRSALLSRDRTGRIDR